MSRHDGLVQNILHGRSDANIRFANLRAFLRYFGYDERVRDSFLFFDEEGIVKPSTCRAVAYMSSAIR